MKKNRMMRLASILLVCVLLSTSVISGTFAKYTSEATSTADTARVAEWDIKLEDAAIADTFTFDLFNTVKDSNGTDNETNVKAGENETIIAPGTSGSFEINLKNDSEVDAEYSIAYTVTNAANIPVEYKIGEGAWTSDITTLNATKVAINMGASAAVTVQWRWAFLETEEANTADTTLGLAGTATVAVAATVTVEQVD